MEIETATLASTASASTSAPASATTSASSPATPTEPRRRNRPALSCIQCRTRKIRCDRMEPCSSCLKSKIVNCTYEEARRPKPRLWRLSPSLDGESPTAESYIPRFASASGQFTFRPDASSSGPSGLQYASSAASLAGIRSSDAASASSSSAPYTDSTTGGHTPLSTSASLEDRIRQLEQQLADARKRQDQGPLPTQSPPGVPFPNHGPRTGLGRPRDDPWVERPKFFPLLTSLAERVEADRNSAAHYFLHKCRATTRAIKVQIRRASDRSVFDIGSSLLPAVTTRQLIESYFRTFESVYRILHRPTFWQEYARYWDNPSAATEAFVIQFKLCMALGACFHDDIPVQRRILASKWVYEAQVWLASAGDKSQPSIEGLQIMCLAHLAREACGVGGDLAWVSAGCVLRFAMHLGLHRDPSTLKDVSVFRAEVRRRLWATVLEIVLQSSLDCGGPPLLSPSDFDTRPPSNFDDEQLLDNEHMSANPRHLGAFTQTTVQIALHRSFPTRLAIAEYVNRMSSSSSYEETLRWNSELTTACRALSAILQPFYDPAGILPKRLSLFQLRLAEHMVHRFFLALNYPWLTQNDPAYYFSRKMCVETSLKLYRAIAAGSPAGDAGTATPTDDFTRLATCGYGAFRSVPMVAVLSICLELLWQVQEDQCFLQSMEIDHPLERSGPASDGDVGSSGGIIGSGAAPKQDLFDAIKHAISWTGRRISAGETNLSGRLFYSALLAQVQALQRGASDVELERAVISTLDADLEQCWKLLREIEAAGPGTPSNVNLEEDYYKVGHPQGFRSIFNSNDVESFLRG